MAEFKAGDTVFTSYGAGVIVSHDGTFYSVRIWRIPGKSVGSSSLARLGSTSVRLARRKHENSHDAGFVRVDGLLLTCVSI